MIMEIIELGGAPSAFLIPISLVLSLTINIIILLIPTIPAIKVPIPIIKTNIANTLLN